MEIRGKACSHDRGKMKSLPQSFDSSEGYLTVLVPVWGAATPLLRSFLFLFFLVICNSVGQGQKGSLKFLSLCFLSQ